MMISIDRNHHTSHRAWRQHLVEVVTLVGWLLLAAFVGSRYVGHSPGPYGTCTAANGRSVDCWLLRHAR